MFSLHNATYMYIFRNDQLVCSSIEKTRRINRKKPKGLFGSTSN